MAWMPAGRPASPASGRSAEHPRDRTPLTTAASRAARARNLYLGIACATVGSIGFSVKTILVKLAYEYQVDPMTLIALRMLMALPFFLLMAWWGGSAGMSAMRRQDWLAIVALGFVGYYLSSYLDFSGLQYISAGLGRLILYLFPTVVMIISAVFLKQPVQRRHVLSLLISYGGILLVFLHDARITDNGPLVALGALLVFGSATTYAIYLVTGSRLVHKLGSMRFTAYASLCATCFIIIHIAATHGLPRLLVPRPVFGLMLLMALLSTVLPMWLIAEAMKRIGANKTALIGCIGPVSTLALAHLFLGEPVNGIQLAGAAFVLCGVMIISLRPKAPAPAPGNQAPAPP